MELDIVRTRVLIHSFVLLTIGLICTSIVGFTSIGKECPANSIYISSISAVWYLVNSVLIIFWYKYEYEFNIDRILPNHSNMWRYLIQMGIVILHYLLCLGVVIGLVFLGKLDCKVNVDILFLLLLISFVVVCVTYLGGYLACMLLFLVVFLVILFVELSSTSCSNIMNKYKASDIFSFSYDGYEEIKD